MTRDIERLRERYEVVELGYDSHTHARQWWWESPVRLRAIAVAVAWDEALDRGGETVPDDPRYGEAFLEYLWRVQRGDLTIADLGHYFAIEERRQAEWAAFATHLASVVAITPQASEPSPAPPASGEESRQL